MRDLLAADVDLYTTVAPNVGDLRVFLGSGPLVRGLALYALVAGDDDIDVVGLERDTTPPDVDDEGPT